MVKYWVRIGFLVILLTVVIGVMLSGCTPSTPSPPTEPSAPTVPETEKNIIIKYSSTTTNQIGDWNEADPGYTYLVLDLDIENRGYDSFSTNSFYFSVVVNKVEYDVAFVVGLENELKMVDLLNGGKARGTLAFEVPTEVSSVGYQIKYEAFTRYDIDWIKQ